MYTLGDKVKQVLITLGKLEKDYFHVWKQKNTQSIYYLFSKESSFLPSGQVYDK